MNQLRENPFLAGVIVVVIAACAGLGFLVSGAMSSYQGTMDAYGQAVQKLQGLQNRVPFPDAANLKNAEDLRDGYKNKLEGLKASFAALQTPINPAVTPQQFQDTLRATVNDVASKADASGVKLPEAFFLGFDQYKDSLPSDKAAPFLDRQLTIISKVVRDLIGPNPESPGIKSIDALARSPLPVEGAAPAPAANAGQQKAQAASDLQKNSFTLGFTAEQGKFRIAFNNLLKSPQFLIIRSLSVKNSNPQGPPVASASEAASATTSPAALFATPSAEKPASQSLNVILGRELLRVDLVLEIVDFPVPVPGAQPPANQPANP